MYPVTNTFFTLGKPNEKNVHVDHPKPSCFAFMDGVRVGCQISLFPSPKNVGNKWKDYCLK